MKSAPVRHDARIYFTIYPARKRPYGWSCPCGATRSGFATGEAAMRSARTHNGGVYR